MFVDLDSYLPWYLQGEESRFQVEECLADVISSGVRVEIAKAGPPGSGLPVLWLPCALAWRVRVVQSLWIGGYLESPWPPSAPGSKALPSTNVE